MVAEASSVPSNEQPRDDCVRLTLRNVSRTNEEGTHLR
jgi:hypothetical protein